MAQVARMPRPAEEGSQVNYHLTGGSQIGKGRTAAVYVVPHAPVQLEVERHDEGPGQPVVGCFHRCMVRGRLSPDPLGQALVCVLPQGGVEPELAGDPGCPRPGGRAVVRPVRARPARPAGGDQRPDAGRDRWRWSRSASPQTSGSGQTPPVSIPGSTRCTVVPTLVRAPVDQGPIATVDAAVAGGDAGVGVDDRAGDPVEHGRGDDAGPVHHHHVGSGGPEEGNRG